MKLAQNLKQQTHPYILTDNGVTVMTKDKPVTVPSTDPSFNAIVQAIREDDWDYVVRFTNKPAAVIAAGYGKLKVNVDGNIYYNNEILHNYVVDRILDFLKEGINIDPLMKFLNKLMLNSSKQCVDDLFSFLEHGNMPVDPDGDFYAYKAVKNNWKDKHSGTIRNQIGDVVEVLRNQVDDNPSNNCSHGLHAGSLQYVNSFAASSDKIIIVKINPKDVVSVPSHDVRKLRCCHYEVTSIYREPLPDTVHCETNNYAPDDEYNNNDDEDNDSDWDSYNNIYNGEDRSY